VFIGFFTDKSRNPLKNKMIGNKRGKTGQGDGRSPAKKYDSGGDFLSGWQRGAVATSWNLG